MLQVDASFRFCLPRRWGARLIVFCVTVLSILAFPWFYHIPLLIDENCSLAVYVLASIVFHAIFCWSFQFILSGEPLLNASVFELVSLASVGYYIFWSCPSVTKDGGDFFEEAAKHYYAIESLAIYRVSLVLLLLSNLVLLIHKLCAKRSFTKLDVLFFALSLCICAIVFLTVPPESFYLSVILFIVFLFFLLFGRIRKHSFKNITIRRI